jgi:hypothetical protein
VLYGIIIQGSRVLNQFAVSFEGWPEDEAEQSAA